MNNRKINVFDFCMMFTNCKEIIIHGWYHNDDGSESCHHVTFTNHLDGLIYRMFKNFTVGQFKVNKKGVLELIAFAPTFD